MTRAKTTMIATALLAGAAFGVLALVARSARAHCDTQSGPVAVAARQALEGGRFEKIAIWVGPEQEAELRERFEQCRPVRRAGGEAAKLADDYFVDTAVRLHREAEGMAFTGVKPAAPLPPSTIRAAASSTFPSTSLASSARRSGESAPTRCSGYPLPSKRSWW